MTSAPRPGPSPSTAVKAPQFLLSALVLSRRLCQALCNGDLVAENDVDLPILASQQPTYTMVYSKDL